MSNTEQYSKVNENRRKEADEIIINRTLYAGGAGLIFVPILDAVALLGLQMYMVRDIASVYNIEFKEQRAKSLITALLGDVATVSLFKFIPGIGTFFGSASAVVIGASSTYALGKVFVKHFEGGGTFLNFDTVASEVYFKKKLAEGKQFVKNIRKKSKKTGVYHKDNNMTDNKSESQNKQTPKADYAELSKQTKKLSEKILSLKNDIESIKQSRQFKPPTSATSLPPQVVKESAIDLNNLCLIKGIGPKTAALLRKSNINNLQDLSVSTPEEIEAILEKEDGRFRLVISDSWILQAQLAVAGNLEVLKKFQKKLS